jgi:hypothetical protein
MDAKRMAAAGRQVAAIRSTHGVLRAPAFANMVHLLSDKVGTAENIGGSWELDGGHCIKRWWLA